MSAYFNGKNVNLNYIFNNNAYTNTVTGDAKVVLNDITEGQDITVTVLMGENVIPKTELHIYGTNSSEYISYVTDDNGRAVVKGIAPITTIDAITEEYTIKAEYTKSIPETFNSIKNNVNEIYGTVSVLDSNITAIEDDITELRENQSNITGALKGKASGTSAIVINDLSQVDHYINVQTQSNNVLSKIKIYSGDANLIDPSIFGVNRGRWVDKESNSVQCLVSDNHYCHILTEKMNSFFEALNGQTFTFSVGNELPSDVFLSVVFRYEEGGNKEYYGSLGRNSLTFTLNLDTTKHIKYVDLRHFRRYTAFTDTATIVNNLKLEIGEKTSYRPYEPPLEHDFGENILSMYPSMIFACDGAEMEVVYNRDVTKAFAEQQREIDKLKAMILEITTK